MLSTAFLLAASMVVGQAEAASVPDEFVRQCNYYLGEWATEAEVEGKLYRGTWTVEWSPEKACIISHWAADTPTGPGKGTRIQGWDAATKKVLVVDFGKNGGSSVERYTILSDRIDEGTIVRAEADGTTRNATARTDRMEQDHFTWVVTEDGKSTVHKFQRIKK